MYKKVVYKLNRTVVTFIKIGSVCNYYTIVLMKSSSESPLSSPFCLITIIILGDTVCITKNGSGEDRCLLYVPGLSDSINRCHFWLYGCKLRIRIVL